MPVRFRLAVGRDARIAAACIAAISTFMISSSASAVAAAASPPTTLKGTPVAGSKGIIETVGQIMARPKLSDRSGPMHPIGHAPQPKPAPPGTPSAPPSPGTAQGGVSIQAPQTVATNFLGGTFTDSHFVPPDSMGAVGPSQFLVGVNGLIRTFNKGTGVADGMLNTTMDSFFSSVRNGAVTTDPRVRYDRLSGRWFVTMITEASPNRALLAVSSGSAITSVSSFTFFFFQPIINPPPGFSGCFLDYDTLGIDVNALYVGGNVFCVNNALQRFQLITTSLYVVRKTSALGGGPIVVTGFPDLTVLAHIPFTPQGADNENTLATTGYVIGVDAQFFGRMVLLRVSDPGGSPSISADLTIAVAPNDMPITVPHLGSDGRNLDAVNWSLMNAVVWNGQLWAAQNLEVDATGAAVRGGGRDGSRWYAFQNLDATPNVAQSGTVLDSAASNPLSYWMPSINASAQGHVAMGGSVAGANHFADAWTAGRLSGDPLNSMQTPFLYTSSSFAYNSPFNDSPQRWGDYSFISPDRTTV